MTSERSGLDGLMAAAAVAAISVFVRLAHPSPYPVDRAHPWGVFVGVWTHVSNAHLVQNMALLLAVAWWAGRRLVPSFLVGAWVANVVWLAADKPAATGASAGVMAVLGCACGTQVRQRRTMAAGALAVLGFVALAGFTPTLLAHATGAVAGLGWGLVGDWHSGDDVHRAGGTGTSGQQDAFGERSHVRGEQEGGPVAQEG